MAFSSSPEDDCARDRVGGGALEDEQFLRLPGDHRNGLHSRRAGPDHADPLAGEVQSRSGPAAGVLPLAAEVLEAGERRDVRRRQAANGRDEELPGELLAGSVRTIQRDLSSSKVAERTVVVNEMSRRRSNLVATWSGIGKDLGLAGVALRPDPVLLQIVGEP